MSSVPRAHRRRRVLRTRKLNFQSANNLPNQPAIPLQLKRNMSFDGLEDEDSIVAEVLRNCKNSTEELTGYEEHGYPNYGYSKPESEDDEDEDNNKDGCKTESEESGDDEDEDDNKDSDDDEGEDDGGDKNPGDIVYFFLLLLCGVYLISRFRGC